MIGFVTANSINITSFCATLRYGKYCGIGYTNYFGEKPIDKLDKVCHKHDICCATSNSIITCGKKCDCQMAWTMMGNPSLMKYSYEMYNCMLYWGAIGCQISSYMPEMNYATDVVVPKIEDKSKGFNYYPIFDNDERKWKIDIPEQEHNKCIRIIKINSYHEYLSLTHEVYNGNSLAFDKINDEISIIDEAIQNSVIVAYNRCKNETKIISINEIYENPSECCKSYDILLKICISLVISIISIILICMVVVVIIVKIGKINKI